MAGFRVDTDPCGWQGSVGCKGMLRRLAKALGGLKLALAALGGPFTLLAAGVTALGVAFFKTQQERKFDDLLESGSVNDLNRSVDCRHQKQRPDECFAAMVFHRLTVIQAATTNCCQFAGAVECH